MIGRAMAIDPGEKRIGVALSDETGTLARGLTVLKHVSLQHDCAEIVKLALENKVTIILMGCSISDDEEETPQVRHAQKIANELNRLSGLPVELWDEHGSTQNARAFRIASGANRERRGGHLDEVAAAVILQDWLDSKDGSE